LNTEPDTTTANDSRPTQEEEEEKKNARARLWTDFKLSVPSSVTPSTKRLVKIEKKYRFAGEDVVEILEVPEDSNEAKIWPLSDKISDETESTTTPTAVTPVASTSASSVPETSVSADSRTSKRSGPRKPKTSLPLLPSSSSQKSKKLSTLDKSAMDWRAHLSTNEDLYVKEQIEANRKAGGYLDKVEFLQRVEKRKDEVLDANKSNKRRR